RRDDGRAVMDEDDRDRRRVEPFDEMQIAEAEPGKGGAQQHLAALRLVDGHVLDGQRLVRFMQDGGFHRRLLPWDRLMLGCVHGFDHIHDVAQRLSYSSWWRHQYPVSLRPLGARSSHWYAPQRPSSPRA